ncbi:hypothetical protein [Halarcobacter sp.]|uniref:hypothetical protein n=1 Tax=Halarcobacter sp. TaxID=2321133 RepID=UPI002AAA8748|nr:hypothetical protein [Halarcobacter sp.]
MKKIYYKISGFTVCFQDIDDLKKIISRELSETISINPNHSSISKLKNPKIIRCTYIEEFIDI